MEGASKAEDLTSMWDIHETIGKLDVGTFVLALHCYSRDKKRTSVKERVSKEARTCGLKKNLLQQTAFIENFDQKYLF